MGAIDKLSNVYRQRVKRMARRLHAEGVDAAVLVSEPNVQYHSGFQHFQTTKFLGWNTALLITASAQTMLFAPRLTFKYAQRRCVADEVIVFEPTPAGLANSLQEATVRSIPHRGRTRMGYEASQLPSAYSRALRDRLHSIDLVDMSHVFLEQRVRKDVAELRRLRQAARIADRGMAAAYRRLSPGVSELQVAAAAISAMYAAGADGVCHCSVKSGLNSALIQSFSSRRKLQRGDAVNIDLGAVREGYCSDLTRTFVVGAPSERQRNLFGLAQEAHRRAVRAIRPGVSATSVDRAARRFLTDAGYGGGAFPHLTGHGIGLEVHETPIMAPGVATRLKAGTVICVEPGVYDVRAGGMRTEDMYLVRKNGVQRLTRFPRDLTWK